MVNRKLSNSQSSSFFLLDGMTVEQHLLRLAEGGSKAFAEKLNPGVANVLGVRVPDLRKLAARIARDDWQAYLASAGTHYMEERMLHGLVLGCVRVDDVERYLALVSAFVPRINSWSVCDVFDFRGKQRFVDAHRERVWQFLAGWMASGREYEVRFGVVMAMKYFIDAEGLPRVLAACDRCAAHEGYYVKMAVAWALSVCYVRFPAETLRYLRGNALDDFTYNRALQKIVESYRVPEADKALIRSMRRK